MFGLPKGSLGERSWKGYKEVARRLRRIGERKIGPRSRRRPILLEGLEDRALMATAGVDYVVTGYKWANPAKITYSIVPDGVQWISGISGLNAAFDAKFGDGVWEREIARALATWQASANINIVPVGDGAFRENALGVSQGDPRFGDIRIGGDPIPGNTSTLAQTYYPPPQGSTAGGDVEINLNIDYGIGSKFDLFSVVLHETGHSLGLGHPTSGDVVMRPIYGGLVDGLDEGDLVGIRQIYGARRDDMYQSQGFGLTSSNPIDVTGVLATKQSATSTGASLTDIGDVEWFSFVAPSYASGSWQVTASASSSSMLSGKVMVYDDAGNLLGQASDPSRWSTDVTASMPSIIPGRRYYAAVTGATDDVFAVGAYSLTVSMSKPPTPVPPPVTPPPTVPTVPTTPTNPSTNPPPTGPIYSTSPMVLPDRFEVNNSTGSATRLGRVVQTSLGGLTLPAADVDYFVFQAGGQGVYQVSAAGATVQIINARGKVVAQGSGSVAVQAARNASLYVRVQAPGTDSVGDYTLSIGQMTVPRRRPMFGRAMARQAAVPAAPWAAALRAARG